MFQYLYLKNNSLPRLRSQLNYIKTERKFWVSVYYFFFPKSHYFLGSFPFYRYVLLSTILYSTSLSTRLCVNNVSFYQDYKKLLNLIPHLFIFKTSVCLDRTHRTQVKTVNHQQTGTYSSNIGDLGLKVLTFCPYCC